MLPGHGFIIQVVVHNVNFVEGSSWKKNFSDSKIMVPLGKCFYLGNNYWLWEVELIFYQNIIQVKDNRRICYLSITNY